MQPELSPARKRSKPLLEKPIDAQESQLQSVIKDYKKLIIPSDSIIRPQNTPQALVQAITCPICLNMLSLPHYQCNVCNNLFCEKCLEDWWKKYPNICIFKCERAQFKTIKRSNTFNAMAQVLKSNCQYCKEPKTLAQLQTHIDKYCPQVRLICQNLGCQQIIKRKDYEKHFKQECDFRKNPCSYCKKIIISKQMESHQQFCPEKQLQCKFQECNKMIKRKLFNEHKLNCSYQPVQCAWCHISFTKGAIEQHQAKCDKKIVTCQWCQQKFNSNLFPQHICEHRKQICQLCKTIIPIAKVKDHQSSCMMSAIIMLIKKNQELQTINKKLIQKIVKLQDKFEEFSQNRQSQTYQVIDRIKLQEKEVIAKDLARIQYSMKSIEKLKKQETQIHLKLPHVSTAWCPFCREIQKKFKGMLQPLINKRKELVKKLQEIQSFRQSKSIVESSKIRQSSIKL